MVIYLFLYKKYDSNEHLLLAMLRDTLSNKQNLNKNPHNNRKYLT